jgi:hypothetical protein
MGATRFVTLLAGFVVAGCGGVVQAGLANAPALGGSPETQVHDVVANGRDACERAMFPQGNVLRGQAPPCAAPGELGARAVTPVASVPVQAIAPGLDWFDACDAALGPLAPPKAEGVSALYLSVPSPWITCESRRHAQRQSGDLFERIGAHRAWGGLAIARP